MKYNRKISDLKKNGFCVIKSVFSESYLNKIKSTINNLEYHKQVAVRGKDVTTSKVIQDLQNKDKIFLDILKNKTITEISMQLLNDKFYRGINEKLPNYILNQYAARSSGNESLDLHIDDRLPSSSDYPSFLLWGIPLINISEFNGSTLVVPKTHKSGKYVVSNSKNIKTKSLNLKKGDLFAFDGRIWHGANANQSNKDRWIIFITFTRWHIKQTYNYPLTFPKKYYKFLDDQLKMILGYASFTKLDQRYGNTQRGDVKYANKIINKIKNKSIVY